MTPKFSLYDFQARGLDEGRAAYKRGANAVLFVGPTGMGKTTLAAFAARGRIDRGGTVAAFAHRIELVNQLAQRFVDVGISVSVNAPDRKAQLHVMMVQTALARGLLPNADFVILDEAHHYASDEWGTVPRTYRKTGAKLMGLTATPERADGRGLGGTAEDPLFDELITVAQVSELVALNQREREKGITPIEVYDPEVHVRALAQSPADTYAARCPGRSCVVFAPNVKTAYHFAEEFKAIDIEAPVVTGELDADTRSGSLARFASGDVRVIINVGVLTEGWDAPICDVCILARKIGSTSLYFQMVGRSRRPYPGNPGKVALLIDLSGNIALHGHPDTDLVYDLYGIGVTSGAGNGATRPKICRKCRRVLVDDLIANPELEKCPECQTTISKIAIPTPEDVELKRVERAAARAAMPDNKRTKVLTTLYVKSLAKGHDRRSAEFAFRGMFKRFPQTEVRINAWREALAIVAAQRGDAWLPPEKKQSA